jgi:DNA processing protein
VPEHNDELPYWLALRRAGLGSTNFALLLARFGSISEAWQSSPEQLAAAGVDRRYVASVAKARAKFDRDAELKPIHDLGLRVFTWLDEDFPEPLRNIEQTPPVLFVRGNIGPAFDPAVAVVGTRNVTPYGRQATEHFVTALADAGVAIISGLARGVDAVAHRVAVERGVPTVAVMAGGIDQVYPRENQGLAARIVEHGCLVSEYPPGIPARPDYFPRRNRILSGLARATLVVEAGEGSGALHTANWAFEQGRDVFAIPGSIFSRQSLGTNQLIREHTAKLVATPEQLCEELNVLTATRQFPLRPAEREAPVGNPRPAVMSSLEPPSASETHPLLQLMDGAPQHVDELARSSGRPVHELSAELQLLALQGKVTETGPMTFAKT